MNPDNGLGPPGPEVGEGRPQGEPAYVEKVVTSHSTTPSPNQTPKKREISASDCTHRCSPRCNNTVDAVRRRQASRRLPPIGTCGCIRDPLTDRHRCGEVSDKQIDAAVQAAEHLFDAGYRPVFDTATLRALSKSGNHRLVDELAGGAR